MITERTLRKWRKEALAVIQAANLPDIIVNGNEAEPVLGRLPSVEWSSRILRLTLELLDQHLLRK